MGRTGPEDQLGTSLGISNDELDDTAKAQGIEMGRGDFLIVRIGEIKRCPAQGAWGGYAEGDAPGVTFENCDWCQDQEIAAIGSGTWGRRGPAQ